MKNITCQPAGDTAVRVQFNENVSPVLNRQIRSFCERLRARAMTGVTEWVPAYQSVHIYYEPSMIDYDTIRAALLDIAGDDSLYQEETVTLVNIPVLYGGESGPDIERVAETSGLSEQQVIKNHTETDYLIYMMGFLPGFPYLGGLREQLATPRLSSPRREVPAGSVGIAGSQTGVYPLASPGGWNLIGKTPVNLFDPQLDNPFLYEAGDRIRFVPISERDYEKIAQQVQNQTFQIKKEVIQSDPLSN